MIKRPMLAETAKDTEALSYPLISTPKIDGIRCLRLDAGAVTRSLKPIPNKYIREILESLLPVGADGEITAGDSFQDCTSAVMKRSGEPEFTYHMFDLIAGGDLEKEYRDRLKSMLKWHREHPGTHEFVSIVQPKVIWNSTELDLYEAEMLEAGYEGIMVRDPRGPYKQGRSTVREGWLLKIKRFVESEAIIIGFEQMMHNDNEAKVNKLGLTERSSSKSGKLPMDTLGKFIVRDAYTGIEFRIGTGEGLTQELRQKIWNNHDKYYNKIVKYKYQDIGVKTAPRIPVFVGFRALEDMDESYRNKQADHDCYAGGCVAPIAGDLCVNWQCSWDGIPF